MTPLSQITAFIAVVEHNGFAAAARSQGLSTAAISRQVSRLEAVLHAQLLHRTTRRISLTEIGASYYQNCKKALSELGKRSKPLPVARRRPPGRSMLSVAVILLWNHIIPG